MYDKILVALALDHGIGSHAIDIAKRLKSSNGKIIAVHVLEPIHSSVNLFVPPDHIRNVRKLAEDEIVKRIGAGKDIEGVVLTGHPGRAITEFAETEGADCIIVGSHKPGLQDYFLGSTAARIVRHSPCSVHVVR